MYGTFRPAEWQRRRLRWRDAELPIDASKAALHSLYTRGAGTELERVHREPPCRLRIQGIPPGGSDGSRRVSHLTR
jgi:hypothetical protein